MPPPVWADKSPPSANIPPGRSPERAKLLAEMFGEIQAQFGGVSDRALWGMTPRNFYAKLQQAERQRRLWMADMAEVLHQAQPGADPKKWIMALRD